MITIPQNVFWIIIALIVLVGVIVVFRTWGKIREAQANVQFTEKQIELKKIGMVEKDLEAKRIKETVVSLPKEQQQKLAQIREDTAELIHKIGYLHSELSERVNRLEAKTEYKKLQKLLKDIEEKEKEVEKNIQKKKGEPKLWKR